MSAVPLEPAHSRARIARYRHLGLEEAAVVRTQHVSTLNPAAIPYVSAFMSVAKEAARKRGGGGRMPAVLGVAVRPQQGVLVPPPRARPSPPLSLAPTAAAAAGDGGGVGRTVPAGDGGSGALFTMSQPTRLRVRL